MGNIIRKDEQFFLIHIKFCYAKEPPNKHSALWQMLLKVLYLIDIHFREHLLVINQIEWFYK